MLPARSSRLAPWQRTPLIFAALAAIGFVVASGCANIASDVLLTDKPCTPDGACAPGYECNMATQLCVPEGTLAGTGGATSSGSGGAGGGAPGCTTIADCPPPSGPCEAAICLGQECGTIAVLGGTVLPAASQVPLDCKTSVCDGLGSVIQDNDDTDVPDDGLECTTDTCNSGIGENTNLPAGDGCPLSNGQFCDGLGACAQCIAASDCTSLPADDFCRQRSCAAGVCTSVNTLDSTPLPVQISGDCQEIVCSGGVSATVTDVVDVPFDDNPCTDDVCTGNVATNPNEPLGTPCGGALTCNATGQCTGCVQASDCPGTDTFCQQRTCMTNVCGFTYTMSGLALPQAQQSAGDCQLLSCNGAGGTVSSADAADVPAPDGSLCTSEACVGGTPQHPALTLNTPCDAGGGIVCDGAGLCVACNSPAQCASQGSVCQDATCAANSCGLDDRAAGDPAKSGAQTSGDCKIVSCDGAGSPLAPSADNGDLPVDGNPCTNDVCTAGTPSNPPAPLGTACPGGVCDAAGNCLAPQAEGAPCTSGVQCASSSCVDGVCCDAACTPTLCQACTAAKTGLPDGTCAPVPSGQDPDVECAVDQTCNGGGACAFTCLQQPTPPGGACPSQCTGGCSNGTCLIDCNAANACLSAQLTCPEGFACRIECGGNSSCDFATIECPDRYRCDIRCTGDCGSATVNCGTGYCDLVCGAGDVCELVDLNCGVNKCSARCNGSAAFPIVDCGGSCDCKTCKLNNGKACNSDDQCVSGNCPPQDDVCCNDPCLGTCEACLLSKSGSPNGQCGDVDAGDDPDSECSLACDGTGNCQ